MDKRPGKTAALYGILAALALVLSWIEAQIPAFFAIPGMKIGLTNIVVIAALYCMSTKSALIINVVRILLVSFLFGNGVSLLYSLAGGVLSTVVMILLKKTGKLRVITVSIVGGITHNIGQIIVAMLLLGTTDLAWYLLILWFTGIGAGAVVGIIGGELCKRAEHIIRNV